MASVVSKVLSAEVSKDAERFRAQKQFFTTFPHLDMGMIVDYDELLGEFHPSIHAMVPLQ